MQVIVSDRQYGAAPGRASVLAAFTVGAMLLVSAIGIAMLVFGTGFLERFTPAGRPTTAQLVAGALAWTFALTAPTAFGLIGVVRLTSAVTRARARRPRVTPAVRLAQAIGDDHVVATNLQLPDGSRVVPELVVGPFGAAIIEELPPAGAVISRGIRTWEVRTGDGKIRMIENPFERAARDAERVRAWFDDDERDHVVKVYAAVVGTDPKAARTPSCALITPEQVAGWLLALPPQRSFDTERRERVVRMIRAAL